MAFYFILGGLILGVGLPAFLLLPTRLAFALTIAVPPTLFQLGNWLYLGYLDPFWQLAAFFTILISLIGALLLGAVIGKLKDARKGQNDFSEI